MNTQEVTYFTRENLEEIKEQRKRLLEEHANRGYHPTSKEYKELTSWLINRLNIEITPSDLVHTNPLIRYEAQRRRTKEE